MRTHTCEKLFSCEVCHRSFTTRRNLGVVGQNVAPKPIDAMAAAQALQQQQYLRSLTGSVGSPAASDTSFCATADPPKNEPI